MLLDIIKAILIAGVPIAVISYYLVIFTSRKVTLKSKNASQLKKELKNINLDENKQAHVVHNILHKKYLKFGGGFYGILAFITYIHVELYQVIDFINNFSSVQNFIQSIGFWMLINFFIEAIMNFITALMWPIYWYKFLPIGSFWVWVIVAILAHTVATRYALTKNNNN
ncbi:MAG: hypothetical protein JKY19_04590 [Alcanivoracaceae bacterium]|nr:hypothetical protein [Alcanivoracaceae bacterium]